MSYLYRLFRYSSIHPFIHPFVSVSIKGADLLGKQAWAQLAGNELAHLDNIDTLLSSGGGASLNTSNNNNSNNNNPLLSSSSPPRSPREVLSNLSICYYILYRSFDSNQFRSSYCIGIESRWLENANPGKRRERLLLHVFRQLIDGSSLLLFVCLYRYQDGITYWHNEKTNETSWEKPV